MGREPVRPRRGWRRPHLRGRHRRRPGARPRRAVRHERPRDRPRLQSPTWACHLGRAPVRGRQRQRPRPGLPPAVARDRRGLAGLRCTDQSRGQRRRPYLRRRRGHGAPASLLVPGHARWRVERGRRGASSDHGAALHRGQRRRSSVGLGPRRSQGLRPRPGRRPRRHARRPGRDPARSAGRARRPPARRRRRDRRAAGLGSGGRARPRRAPRLPRSGDGARSCSRRTDDKDRRAALRRRAAMAGRLHHAWRPDHRPARRRHLPDMGAGACHGSRHRRHRAVGPST